MFSVWWLYNVQCTICEHKFGRWAGCNNKNNHMKAINILMNWVNIHYTHLINEWKKRTKEREKILKKSTKFLLLIISTTCFWPWFILYICFCFFFFIRFVCLFRIRIIIMVVQYAFISWFAPCATNSVHFNLRIFCLLCLVFRFRVAFSVQFGQ